MPDFRKTIDEANFKPEYTTNSTTGPNAEGQEQTWVNPNPQLTQSSAQELASLMGASLVPVTYSGGPYSTQKPQWQLDFSSAKGDELDASMVDANYQNRPTSFNQQMTDELAYLRNPAHQGAVADERTWAEKGLAPINPLHPGAPAGPGGPSGPGIPGGSGGMTPGPTWPAAPPANIPGPVWPAMPPANIPGPEWPNVPPVPGPTGVNPIVKSPDSGVADPGGYTRPTLPANPIPPSLLMNNPQPRGGIQTNYLAPAAANAPQMPGLLSPEGPYAPKKQTLTQNGLLGLRKPDGTPYTPAELAAFGATGRPPQFSDKEPPYVEPTSYRSTRSY